MKTAKRPPFKDNYKKKKTFCKYRHVKKITTKKLQQNLNFGSQWQIQKKTPLKLRLFRSVLVARLVPLGLTSGGEQVDTVFTRKWTDDPTDF